MERVLFNDGLNNYYSMGLLSGSGGDYNWDFGVGINDNGFNPYLNFDFDPEGPGSFNGDVGYDSGLYVDFGYHVDDFNINVGVKIGKDGKDPFLGLSGSWYF